MKELALKDVNEIFNPSVFQGMKFGQSPLKTGPFGKKWEMGEVRMGQNSLPALPRAFLPEEEEKEAEISSKASSYHTSIYYFYFLSIFTFNIDSFQSHGRV